MASVAESLFADDARSRRKKKKRHSSKHIDAVVTVGGSGGDAADVDAAWQQFTSPDGRTYYYNQVTSESRWKLPRALRQKQDRADRGDDQRASEPVSEVPPTATPMQRKEKEKRNGDVPSRSSNGARGDIVARLQASLAGRINPMGGGPPPMIKIPRGETDVNHSSTEHSNSNGGGTVAFSSSSEAPEADQYDAEMAGMTSAERLRFLRRKRQESMFHKEKIVQEDDFMKEFATNMKKKEAARTQRMTPEELQREAEHKKREADVNKRREEEAERKRRYAEEEAAEREKERQREEQQRLRWEEEKKAQEEEDKQKKARLRDEREREEQERRRKEEEEEKRRREKEETERRQQEEEEREHQKSLARQRSRRTSSSSASTGFPMVGGEDHLEREPREPPARQRSRSNGSKTFAAEAVAYSETHPRSRPSSRRSVNGPEEESAAQPVDSPVPTTTTESLLFGDAPEPTDTIAESLEVIHLETEEETAEERAARKERRRKKREERKRREQEEQEEGGQEEEAGKDGSPDHHPAAHAVPSHCQCAACLDAQTGHLPPHHHPSLGAHGSYPYYHHPPPPAYPPSPYYPPPPPPHMYGYGMPPPPPPPFYPMYTPPPLMFPPGGMFQMPMLMAAPPGSGPLNPLDSSTGALMTVSPYAQYAPPILSQCECCRGRSVGLAEKNGLCAHCNRLRLDFIVASAQIRTRCSSCGGWGLGLVQSNGMCTHCTRVASEAAKEAQPQATGDWDASSSDGDSDWDE